MQKSKKAFFPLSSFLYRQQNRKDRPLFFMSQNTQYASSCVVTFHSSFLIANGCWGAWELEMVSPPLTAFVVRSLQVPCPLFKTPKKSWLPCPALVSWVLEGVHCRRMRRNGVFAWDLCTTMIVGSCLCKEAHNGWDHHSVIPFAVAA